MIYTIEGITACVMANGDKTIISSTPFIIGKILLSEPVGYILTIKGEKLTVGKLEGVDYVNFFVIGSDGKLVEKYQVIDKGFATILFAAISPGEGEKKEKIIASDDARTLFVEIIMKRMKCYSISRLNTDSGKLEDIPVKEAIAGIQYVAKKMVTAKKDEALEAEIARRVEAELTKKKEEDSK